MNKQIYWEDITNGQDLPVLVKRPTNQLIVKFCGASGEFSPIHYDKDHALKVGMPGVIAHGWLTFSFITQLVTNWIGDKGRIKKIKASYRGMFPAGEDISCKAKVVNKFVKDNEHLVELEIWAENPKGEKLTPGTALVMLPVKS